MKRVWGLLGAVAALGLVGCNVAPPPDPNDPTEVGLMAAEVLQRNLVWASRTIQERVERGEISDEEGQSKLSEFANDLTDKVDLTQVEAPDAWRYGDVFRTAKRWDLAEKALTQAVDFAKRTRNEDRRVNDSLRLAQAKAHLGKLDEAFALVRSTFNVPAKEKAPILMATLYEVAPAAEGKGRDLELSKLLEETIAQHEAVVVDPQTESGQAFLAARSRHIGLAWGRVVELARAGGGPQAAAAAIDRARSSSGTRARA